MVLNIMMMVMMKMLNNDDHLVHDNSDDDNVDVEHHDNGNDDNVEDHLVHIVRINDRVKAGVEVIEEVHHLPWYLLLVKLRMISVKNSDQVNND